MIEFNHIQQALKEYADAIRDQYKDNLEDSGRRATGNLINTVKSFVSVSGNTFEVCLDLAPYWKWIEEGRPPTHSTKPNEPPLRELILDWITVKGILLTPMPNGKLPTEKQLAFLITRKIHNEGYEGSYDLEHTMEQVDYENIIEEALDKDIMECLDEILLFK